MKKQNTKNNQSIWKIMGWSVLVLMILLALPNSVYAIEPITDPYSGNPPTFPDPPGTPAVFSANTPASAEHVNKNFEILRAKTNEIIAELPTSGESPWTDLNPNIYYNGGNVGIGTSNPSELLHVQQASVDNPIAAFYDPSLSSGNFTSVLLGKDGTAGNAGVIKYVHSNSDGHQALELSVNTGGTLTLKKNGDVGIGTTNPVAALNVVTPNEAPVADLRNTYANGYGVYIQTQSTGTEYSLHVKSNGGSKSLLFVRNDGNVGIGTTSPTYALHVVGNTFTTGSYSSSDQRFKKNVHALGDSLEKLIQLRGVSFEWRAEEFPENRFKSGNDIGVIAQEMEKVFPEIVSTDEDGYKAVNYSKLVVPLIEATKSQQTMIEQQQQTIEQLTVLLQQAQKQMASMSQEIKNIKAVMHTMQESPKIQTAAFTP